MEASSWYAALIKPTWAPPAWLFGPVWTFLYAIIAVSFGYVFYKIFTGAIPWVVAIPFVINLISNAIFSPLQFNLESNLLAAIDIVVVLVSLIAAMIMIFPYAPWVAYVNIPYLLWVSFATVLQFTITYLNW